MTTPRTIVVLALTFGSVALGACSNDFDAFRLGTGPADTPMGGTGAPYVPPTTPPPTMVPPVLPTPDAGKDAGRDAGRDAGQDAGHDAGTDAGDDAGTDDAG